MPCKQTVAGKPVKVCRLLLKTVRQEICWITLAQHEAGAPEQADLNLFECLMIAEEKNKVKG